MLEKRTKPNEKEKEEKSEAHKKEIREMGFHNDYMVICRAENGMM